MRRRLWLGPSTMPKKYGGDPERLFVSGHSAGGFLTSMVGLDKSRLAGYGKDADSIAGLIPFSGQVITHFSDRKSKGIGELTPYVDSNAPLFHVRKDAPPYIIVTGDAELELYGRYEENLYMWRMMKLNGHPDVKIYKTRRLQPRPDEPPGTEDPQRRGRQTLRPQVTMR